jgi:hypothetical protein
MIWLPLQCKNTLTKPLYPAQQLGVLAENEVDDVKPLHTSDGSEGYEVP